VIYILSGPVGVGKTTFLEGMVVLARGLDPNFDGFLSPRVIEDGRTAGYDLLDLKTETRIPLLRRSGDESWLRTGPYRMLPDGLAAGEAIIRRSFVSNLLIVDEIGPLEFEGRGFWPALKDALEEGRSRKGPVLVVIRSRLVRDLRKKFSGHPSEVIEFKKQSFESFLKKILKI
jgi:nucleoside-triphosphatase THEP1